MKQMAKGRERVERKKHRTLREVVAWGMAPNKPERVYSMRDWRWLRDSRRALMYKQRRFTIGYIRAFAGPHIFAGCYPGAENE